MSKKKIGLFLICLLIILLVGIVLIIGYLRNKINNNELTEIGSSIVDDYGKIENNSISRASYFDINTCVTSYLHTLNIKRDIYYGKDDNGQQILIVEENEIKQKIYDLLSTNYINKNNITIENVYEYVNTLERQVLFVPIEATVIQDAEITSFLVHGLVESLDLNVMDEIFLIVNIDATNRLFSIEPIKGNYNSIDKINIEKLEEKIENNDNNKFSRYSVSYETTVKDYINLYKRLALGKPEIMYNLLDEEYRNAKFGSLEEFKKYINTNKNAINSIRVEKYKVTEQDDYTQYLCVDQNNNRYIFREKGILKYSVILDTYTIDLPEFIAKYEASDDNLKVALNVEKMIDATKAGDYKYVYSKLDNNFKSANFPTQASLEKYIKEKYSENDNIEYIKYEKINNVHVYDIEITKIDGNIIKAQILMQLKKGTDFVMSFSTGN